MLAVGAQGLKFRSVAPGKKSGTVACPCSHAGAWRQEDCRGSLAGSLVKMASSRLRKRPYPKNRVEKGLRKAQNAGLWHAQTKAPAHTTSLISGQLVFSLQPRTE